MPKPKPRINPWVRCEDDRFEMAHGHNTAGWLLLAMAAGLGLLLLKKPSPDDSPIAMRITIACFVFFAVWSFTARQRVWFDKRAGRFEIGYSYFLFFGKRLQGEIADIEWVRFSGTVTDDTNQVTAYQAIHIGYGGKDLPVIGSGPAATESTARHLAAWLRCPMLKGSEPPPE